MVYGLYIISRREGDVKPTLRRKALSRSTLILAQFDCVVDISRPIRHASSGLHKDSSLYVWVKLSVTEILIFLLMHVHSWQTSIETVWINDVIFCGLASNVGMSYTAWTRDESHLNLESLFCFDLLSAKRLNGPHILLFKCNRSRLTNEFSFSRVSLMVLYNQWYSAHKTGLPRPVSSDLSHLTWANRSRR